MTDGFDVDPEAIRDIGFDLRDGLEPMVQAAGQLPEADAGLMTLVIEKAIAALLEGLTGHASKVAAMGDNIVRSSLNYHWADQEAQAALAQLLVPGTSEVEAERLVADAPGSTWDTLADEELAPLPDLYAVDGGDPAPSTTGGQHGDGLEGLLLGPLEDDGKGRPDAD